MLERQLGQRDCVAGGGARGEGEVLEEGGRKKPDFALIPSANSSGASHAAPVPFRSSHFPDVHWLSPRPPSAPLFFICTIVHPRLLRMLTRGSSPRLDQGSVAPTTKLRSSMRNRVSLLFSKFESACQPSRLQHLSIASVHRTTQHKAA